MGKKLKRKERKWESSCRICPRRTKIQKLLSFREKNQEGSFQQNKDSEREVRLPPERRGRISFMGLLSESNRKKLKRLHLLRFPQRSLRVDLTALQTSTQGDMFPLSDRSVTRSGDYKVKPAGPRHAGYSRDAFSSLSRCVAEPLITGGLWIKATYFER